MSLFPGSPVPTRRVLLAISVLTLFVGPLLCLLLALSERLIPLLQEWGYHSAQVLYRGTWFDPSIYVPLSVCATLGVCVLGLLYRSLYRHFGRTSVLLHRSFPVISFVLGLFLFSLSCIATLFVLDFYNPGVKADVTVASYRLVLVQRTKDLDYPSVYLYIFNKEGQYYRKDINGISWDCTDFEVITEARVIRIRSVCGYKPNEREIIQIDRVDLAVGISANEEKTFRPLQTLTYENQ